MVDQILEEAFGLTTGQLRACLQRLCIEADPEEAAKRYEDRLAERRVESRSNPERTANLYGLDLAPNKVAAIRGHIEVLARQLKRSGDPRTMDQLRADIYIDHLLGRHNQKTSGGGVITMTASLETLAGLAEQAAEIPGLGPVISDIAQQVLEEHPGAELRYKITTPDSGVLIGTPSRTATTALRRFVEIRDETCMGIGMPHGCQFLRHRPPPTVGRRRQKPTITTMISCAVMITGSKTTANGRPGAARTAATPGPPHSGTSMSPENLPS